MNTSSNFCRSLILVGLIYGSSVVAQTASPPTTNNPGAAGSGESVGVAKRDGITVSGGEAFVTRNGVTEKMTKELVLPSGVVARPDGTVLLTDKTTATLRGNQTLTFDGKLMNLPADPNVNPGDRSAPVSVSGTTAGGAGTTSSQATATGTGMVGSSRSMPTDRPNNNGSVYLGADGVPFMGTQNADGSITRADGTVIPFDSALRSVSFGPNGTPSLGAVDRNGAINTAQQQGLSNQSQLGTAANGNSNPGVQQNSGTTQTNNGVTGGSTNAPNNQGTINGGTSSGVQAGTTNNNPTGATANSGGTAGGSVNNSNSNTGSVSGTSGSRTGGSSSNSGSSSGSTRGTNGATGGAASGGGASGAGGASGGAAGGASR